VSSSGPRSDDAVGDTFEALNAPTGHAARYTGGLSAARFLRPLTVQRIDDDVAASPMAEAVVAISQAEGDAAHGATAAKRMQRLPAT
jgi:sulfopropanediol 3-dehydrogenase